MRMLNRQKAYNRMGYNDNRRPSGWCFSITIWFLLGIHAAIAAPSDTVSSTPSPAAPHNPDGKPVPLYQKISDAVDATVSLSAGLRLDEFQWSIAGNSSGTNPKILSELEWDEVSSYQLTLAGRLEIKRRFYCRGHGNVAWIESGSLRDSDYDGDGRTLEYSRSISETNGDELYDIVAGVGYPFHFKEDRFFLAPMLGISYHAQNFRITNGEQVISDASHTPALGPLDNRLNSTYSARWFGPWAGCDVRYLMETSYRAVPRIIWDLSLMLHFLNDYSAEADWNLRGDLDHPKSFEHEADGDGISLTAKCQIPLNQRFGIHLMATYASWSTDGGKATVYRTSGTRYTRLNEVEWETHSVMIGFDCLFF